MPIVMTLREFNNVFADQHKMICIVCPHTAGEHKWHPDDDGVWCQSCMKLVNSKNEDPRSVGPCTLSCFLPRHEYEPRYPNSAMGGKNGVPIECWCRLAADSDAHKKPFAKS